MRNKGYMIVKYTADIPYYYYGQELLASGSRLYTQPTFQGAIDKLKAILARGESRPDFKLIRKDLRIGWFICVCDEQKLMFAIMPYSIKKIIPIKI